MKTLFLNVLLLMATVDSFAQQKNKIEVLTLGCFHFNFPNLDVIKASSDDQINVLELKYQKEINEIVARIAKFKPTIIVIEREPTEQAKYDSLYNEYLQGRHNLHRNEEQQIGFRIAKLMSLKKLYCVDSWGRDYEVINAALQSKDSIQYKKFMTFFTKSADTIKQYFPKPIYKTKGIRADLIQKNKSENVKLDFGT